MPEDKDGIAVVVQDTEDVESHNAPPRRKSTIMIDAPEHKGHHRHSSEFSELQRTVSVTPMLHKGGIRSYWRVSLLCLFAAMGGFMYGYDTGTISGYINMPQYVTHFGETNSRGYYYFSKVRDGLLVGTFSIGGCFGGVFGGKAADAWGRRVSIMLASGAYIVGVVIQIASFSAWYQMLIGRIVGGFGIGALAVLVPMFQSETAPQELRGALVSSFQLMITFGIFIGYCVCFGTHDFEGPSSYRIPMGLCFVWSVILILGMTVMPESPRYLLLKNRVDEARAAMCFIYQRKQDDPEIAASVAEIMNSIEEESAAGDARWSELVTGQPRIWYRVVMGTILQSLQQLCGANYFFYYGTTIFSSIGMTNSFATSMIFGGVNFLSTFAGLYNIEKFGRRGCMLGGAVAMFVFFIIFACLGTQALFPKGALKSDAAVGKAMIAVTCMFIFSFATTWAPVTFVVVSEIYPLRIKSKGMAIATGANWFWNFMISFFTPFITGSIGYYYGFVFSGCLLFSLFFVYFFVPETKGLSLEQIDKMFAAKIKPWQSKSWLEEMTPGNAENEVPKGPESGTAESTSASSHETSTTLQN